MDKSKCDRSQILHPQQQKQCFVIEVEPGVFVSNYQRRGRMFFDVTRDLYSAEKSFSLEEAAAKARKYREGTKIRELRISFALEGSWSAEEAENKVQEVFDAISDRS